MNWSHNERRKSLGIGNFLHMDERKLLVLSTGAPVSLASNRKGRTNRNYELKHTPSFIKFRFTWLNNLRAQLPFHPLPPATSLGILEHGNFSSS